MTDAPFEHEPVMVEQLLHYLAIEDAHTVVDATFGLGGHARAVLQHLGPSGRLFGLERDPDVFSRARDRFGSDSRVCLIRASYRDMGRCLRKRSVHEVEGVYFDLGLGSFHLESSGRGFSFQHPEEPLDCRFNPDAPTPTAAEWVNRVSREQLRRVLDEYGEVRRLDRITDALMRHRPIETVQDVRDALASVLTPGREHSELARVFQAFRIQVNQELSHLRDGLREAFSLLATGGRLVVISFHSLEDRIVKGFFRHEATSCVCPPDFPVCACEKVKRCEVLTSSAVQASEEEVRRNPRARSARLRAGEKLKTSVPEDSPRDPG